MFKSKSKDRKITKESFMKGILVLMFSQVLIKLLGLVYKLYLTNKEGFGDAGNAIYNSGYQIYALLLTISSVGVPNAISKLISEKVAIGDNKGAYRIFKISLITFGIIGAIGTSILFFGARYIANDLLMIPEAELTLVALSPSVFFVTIASVFRGYFNAREKISVTAKSQTLEQVFKTVLTVMVVEIIAIASRLNTTLMAAGANLATTLSVLLSFGYLFIYYKMYRKDIGTDIKNSVNYKKESIKSTIKKILWVSIPISLSAITSSLNKNIDSFTVVRLLSEFMSEAEAKIQYGILSGKVDTLITLPLSFNVAFATALVPAISSSIAKNDRETVNKRISFSLLLTILIGMPCTFGMIVFADPIIRLLFPNATDGALLLQISALAIIFTLLIQTCNGALQGLGRVYVPAIAGIVGLIIKFILNIVLIRIPSIGINGAAISSTIYHIFALAIVLYILMKTIKIKFSINKYIVKPIVATLAMCVCSYYIYTILNGVIAFKLAIIISLASAVLIYVIMVIILKIFTKEEIYMIPYGYKFYKILENTGIYKKK